MVATKRTNWRQVIDLLTGKTEKNLESYGDAVTRLAAGEGLDPAAVEKLLAAVGRSPDDLERDVTRKAERLRLVAEIDRLELLALEGERADAEIGRLVSAHNATVERMSRELTERLEPLRMKTAESAPARSQADDVRRRLIDGADPELVEQSRQVHDDLREAVADEQHAFAVLDERRSLLGVKRDDPAVADLRIRAEQLANRVRELQSQSESIMSARVKP